MYDSEHKIYDKWWWFIESGLKYRYYILPANTTFEASNVIKQFQTFNNHGSSAPWKNENNKYH